MQKTLAATVLLTLAARAIASAKGGYPVFSPGAGGTKETCEGITCADLECKPPFAFKSEKDTGTCCPLCLAESVKVPADRSWTKGLSGGIGINNNADPVLCRDAVCLPLDCPEYDQFFDGRCCTKCKSSKKVTPADLAKDYKDLP